MANERKKEKIKSLRAQIRDTLERRQLDANTILNKTREHLAGAKVQSGKEKEHKLILQQLADFLTKPENPSTMTFL